MHATVFVLACLATDGLGRRVAVTKEPARAAAAELLTGGAEGCCCGEGCSGKGCCGEGCSCGEGCCCGEGCSGKVFSGEGAKGFAGFAESSEEYQAAEPSSLKALSTLLQVLQHPPTAWNARVMQVGHKNSALPPPLVQRTSASKMLLDDSDLSRDWAERVAGISKEEELFGVPLSPEETIAEEMGPEKVVSLVFNVFQKESQKASTLFKGSIALMGFSIPINNEEKVDSLGHLQPGAFSSAQDLGDFFISDPRYSSLALMDEWKPDGEPEWYEGKKIALQNMSVRRKGSSKWEPMTCTLVLTQTEVGQAWRIYSINKASYYDDDGNLLSPR